MKEVTVTLDENNNVFVEYKGFEPSFDDSIKGFANTFGGKVIGTGSLVGSNVRDIQIQFDTKEAAGKAVAAIEKTFAKPAPVVPVPVVAETAPTVETE